MTPGEELAAIGDVDVDALVVGELEQRACDLDDLAVDLGDVDVHLGVVAPHPLDHRAAAQADDERARRVGLHRERDVQVADVFDGGLERVVDEHRRLLVALELEQPHAVVVGDGEAVEWRVEVRHGEILRRRGGARGGPMNALIPLGV